MVLSLLWLYFIKEISHCPLHVLNLSERTFISSGWYIHPSTEPAELQDLDSAPQECMSTTVSWMNFIVPISPSIEVFKGINSHLISFYGKRQVNISESGKNTSQTFLKCLFLCVVYFMVRSQFWIISICLPHENNLSCKYSFWSFSI